MCSVVLIVGAVGLVVWALAVPAPAKMMAAIAGPAKQAPIVALVPNRMTIPLCYCRPVAVLVVSDPRPSHTSAASSCYGSETW